MVSLFRTDATIKKDVESEIQYDPSIQHDETIAVAVKDGIVTLSGVTKSYMDSYYAEKVSCPLLSGPSTMTVWIK
ncbi:BON domain-containing protein, partial [Sphingomonas paucimobilis]|uniref:BON domain-containing protein n=1 Tax=Sphingomonas paucimobilis TaxID=13689 RepID=UPI003D94C3D6